MQGLLNEWRRTNYTKNVTPDLTGQDHRHGLGT